MTVTVEWKDGKKMTRWVKSVDLYSEVLVLKLETFELSYARESIKLLQVN